MKKFYIFLFALTLLFTSLLFVNTKSVKAEGVFTIKITSPSNVNINTDVFPLEIETSYSQNDSLTLCADLYDGDTLANLNNLTYKWAIRLTEAEIEEEKEEVVVCEDRTWVLNKQYSENRNNIMTIGEKDYTVTISGDSFEQTIDFKLIINSDNNFEIIVTEINRPLAINSNGAYILNNNTAIFQINAFVSMSNVDCTINWFVKKPNSSTYDLLYENGNCTIIPSLLINSTNGFGTYKIYASAKSSSVLFTSKILYFEGVAGELQSDLSVYKILKRVINNTKSDLEAYTFTLENAKEDNLDNNKILWYVNDVKMGKGYSFSYEPTNSEPFVVTVKYQNTDFNIIELKEMETTPRTTGTLKLALVLLGGVLVLSLIFGITVRALNKKRDVVW